MFEEVTRVNFAKVVLESNEPVIVDVWAPWCASCKALRTHLEKLALENRGIRVVTVNASPSDSVAHQLQVHGLPTMIFFRDGVEVGRYASSPGSYSSLRSVVRSNLRGVDLK